MWKYVLFLAACTLIPTSTVHTEHKKGHCQYGKASWYGPGFYGRKTASGEIYTGKEMTAAHRYLKFGTIVKVTHTKTGKSIQVRINDRGPYVKGRIIDLSRKAAEELGIIHSGVASVEVCIVH